MDVPLLLIEHFFWLSHTPKTFRLSFVSAWPARLKFKTELASTNADERTSKNLLNLPVH